MKVELNETQLRNLLVFLNRVQLTGQEADELVMLKLTLGAALNVNGPVAEPVPAKTGKEK